MTLPRWAWITIVAVSAILLVAGTVWWLRTRSLRTLPSLQGSSQVAPGSVESPSAATTTPSQVSAPALTGELPAYFAPPLTAGGDAVLDGAAVPFPPLFPPAASSSQAAVNTEGEGDKDQDGLTQDQERQAGTNPEQSDTDSDELSDGDEVRKYRTDPLKKDSDGDGYSDAQEIKNGYNPLGTGKCLTSDCAF